MGKIGRHRKNILKRRNGMGTVGKILIIVFLVGIVLYILQFVWAHRKGQKYFAENEKIVCTPVLGWFTREDRIAEVQYKENKDLKDVGFVQGPEFSNLQPGDILLTLSTHSLGWRHGHAALVIDEKTALECAVLGTDSQYTDPQNWRTYSGYCVLRVKDAPEEVRKAVAVYAGENLCGVPYHLSAGFVGEKAPDPESGYFGLQCAYLVWYAWHAFGYDLDADRGRLVSASDILCSDLLEVVQVWGMNMN